MAKNKVLAGDYEGFSVKSGWNTVTFSPPLFSGHASVELN